MNWQRTVPTLAMCGVALAATTSFTTTSMQAAPAPRTGTWTKLTNQAPDFTGSMLLLTDGSVMVQGYDGLNRWMKLRPDATGSYIDGTWSELTPMSRERLYTASHVLPNGNVWILGGEYSGTPLNANWTNTGEVYNTLANTWSPIANHPDPFFGDDPTMLLDGSRILAGSLTTRNSFIYDTATNTWSGPFPKVYNDRSDEETWAKIPGGKVLTYDLFKSIATGGSYAELFDPATNTWASISPSDGTASGFIPQLSSPAVGFELGPIVRLQDGRLFVIGATQHTAFYTPATNTWSAGPDIIGTRNGNPAFFGADDAPGAVLPNGHVIFAADSGPTGIFEAPTHLFDFNPETNTIGPLDAPFPVQGDLDQVPAFVTRMLVLPTGQLLFSDSDTQLWVYTPAGSAPNRLQPRVEGITYTGGGVFTLSGQQLTGQSAGSSYGDDAESDENYPVIWLTGKDGRVAFGRTTNWTTTDVATGTAKQSVQFTLPPGVTPGVYKISVSAAGIGSVNSVSRNIKADEIAGN